MASLTFRVAIASLLVAAVLGVLAAVLVPRAIPAAGRAAPAATTATTATTVTSSPAQPSSMTSAPAQLSGRILDADGNPVADARVRVVAVDLRPPRVVTEASTDGRGSFAFARLARLANRRVRVEADHDPQGEVRSALIALTAEPSPELTLVLAPAGVRGVVVDADDGHPLAGATLSVEGAPWDVARVTTDASGGFRFSLVPFEATAVVAVASGYRSARASFGPREDQPEPVLRIALVRGDPPEGDVLDPDGKPLHAQVVACEGQPAEARVESGDDGTFKLPPSAVGCPAVALHDGMAPSDPMPVEDGRRTTLRLGLPGAIEGSVVDDRGRTVDSATVGVESVVAPHNGGSHPKPGPFSGGSFRLERLTPGTYVLVASTQGRPPARSDPIEVRAGSVTDGVRIVLAPGGVVVGRVLDDRSTPLEGADLHFDLVSAVAGSDAAATTDAFGRYRLEGAPSGPLTLRVHKDGYRVKLVSGLVVASGSTLTKDIVLSLLDGGPGTEFGGIGAGLAAVGNTIVFSAVFAGNPAERAGVRQGDRVVRIDGEDAAGMSVADAIQRLRGEPGQAVGLTVERAGAMIDLMLVREEIVR